MEDTTLFDVAMIKKNNIKITLNEVCESLALRGYDPIKQLVGYLMSGDPGYISSFQNARAKVISLGRAEILNYLLKEVLS